MLVVVTIMCTSIQKERGGSRGRVLVPVVITPVLAATLTVPLPPPLRSRQPTTTTRLALICVTEEVILATTIESVVSAS